MKYLLLQNQNISELHDKVIKNLKNKLVIDENIKNYDSVIIFGGLKSFETDNINKIKNKKIIILYSPYSTVLSDKGISDKIFQKYVPETYETYKDDKQEKYNKIWIEKPRRGSCGRNISVIRNIKEWNKEGYILQSYISPYLINNKKFDLRILVGIIIKPINLNNNISNIDLEYYMEPDAIMRFCHKNYDNESNDIDIHITNASIQKKYCDLSSTELFSRHITLYNHAINKIKEIINYTMEKYKSHVMENLLKENLNNKHNLESVSFYTILGYDMIIDNKKNVYLLEINNMPRTFDSKYSNIYYNNFCNNFGNFLLNNFFINVN